MMLSRREVSVIQKLLQSGKNTAPSNPTWKRICDHYSIGTTRSGKFVFSSADLTALRNQVNEIVIGDDILHVPLAGSRSQISSTFANEKISMRPVFSELVWGARHPSRPIRINGASTSIPRGSCLAFDYRGLEVDADDCVVIVENGEAFLAADTFTMPAPYKEAIWIYRGHTENQSAVRALVKQLAGTCPVVGFFDCDPAGVLLGLQMGVSALLLPVGWNQHYRSHPAASEFNKTALFHRQEEKLRNLRPTLLPPALAVVDAILTGEWSLTQEHMAAHYVPLEIVSIVGGGG